MKMKHRKIPVALGGENFPMTITLKIDGKVVRKQPAHSFLAMFLRMFCSFANGKDYGDPVNTLRARRSAGTSVFYDSFVKPSTVSIVSGKLRLTTPSSHFLQTGDVVYTMGINGITGFTNGFHEVTAVTSTILELTNTSGLSGSHSDGTSAAYIYLGRPSDGTNRADSFCFGGVQVRVGSGTAANTLSTDSLEHEIPSNTGLSGVRTFALSSSDPTVDEPSVGATTSTIEIEQSFVNNSGSSIDVNEIGLWGGFDVVGTNERYYALFVRDVLGSTETVGNGQTLTVVYELNTDVPTTDGGVLIQFNEIFYRQLAQTTRESKDIFNQNSVKGPSSGQFWLNSSGGDNPLSTGVLSPTSNETFRVGPRVGTSTTNVVNTNFRLQDAVAADTAIKHGDGTGQLYHYGAYVSPLVIDGSEISFEVSRIFENRSGSDITINEVGLYQGYVSSNSIEVVHCIARHLITPIVLANGEFLKLTYSVATTA